MAKKNSQGPGSRTRGWPALLGLSAASGLLLFLSDHPVHVWTLQTVALVPFLFGLMTRCRSVLAAALSGFCVGVFYIVPLMVVLEFPFIFGLAQALYIGVLWVLTAIGAHFVLRWKAPFGPLAMGAVSAFVEWINFSVVPIWGTAQCFARIWTETPMAVQFISVTGVTGLVFVLVAAQALAASLIADGSARLRSAVALAVLLLVPAAYNVYAWSEKPRGTIRVAAVGWGRGIRAGRSSPYLRMDRIIEPNLRKAGAAGARLVVTPEVGLWLGPASRAPILERLGAIGKQYRMTLVVGYFDRKRNTNRAAYITPDGKVRDEYVKTHLIPTLEKYRAGTGRLTRVNVNDVPVGAMICQDDNFTDLARGYGRKRVRIVAVPTNDWAQVKKYHFDNSRFRPIENRYGIVRAASHGISAIVSAKGEVLARMDHLERGTGVIVADLPLYSPGSLYAVGGDWFVVLCALGLALGVRWTIAARRNKSVRT